MELLTASLRDAGCGVGIGIKMPAQWQGHVWQGYGTPDTVQASAIADALKRGDVLPSQEELAFSPDLEATALLALDWSAEYRLVAVLHADDPVLLASSLGGAQTVQTVFAKWAFRYKTTPHCSSAKSVVMACGPPGCGIAASRLPPLVMRLAGRSPSPLTYVSAHKWLGLL